MSIYHSQRGTNDGRLVDSQLNRQKGKKADSSHSYTYVLAHHRVNPSSLIRRFSFLFSGHFFLSLNTFFLYSIFVFRFCNLGEIETVAGSTEHGALEYRLYKAAIVYVRVVDKSKGGRLLSALSVNMGSCSAGESVAMGLARYGWLRHGLARLASHQAYSKCQWRKRVKE